MHDVLDVIRNIQDLYENNSSLSVLKDFERVLDELDMYVYDNWIDGELAYGPKVDRHWITVGFMWPKKVAFDMYKGYMNKMKNEEQEPIISQNNTTTPVPPAAGMAPPMPTPPAGGAAPGMMSGSMPQQPGV